MPAPPLALVGVGELEEGLLERRARSAQAAQVDAALGQRAGDDRGVLGDGRGDDGAVFDAGPRRARAPPTVRHALDPARSGRRGSRGRRRRRRTITSSSVPLGDQPARLEDDDVVAGRFDFGQAVGAEQRRRAALGQRADEVADLDRALGVESVGRLVEDDDRGVADQGQGDPDPLAHPQRERADLVVGAVGETDADAGSRGTSASLGREADRGGPDLEVLASALAFLYERRRLDDHPGAAGRASRKPGDPASWPRIRAWPEVGRCSPSRTRIAVDLPAPLGPSRPTTLPSGTREGEVVEHRAMAEALDQALELDRRARRGHVLPLSYGRSLAVALADGARARGPRGPSRERREQQLPGDQAR